LNFDKLSLKEKIRKLELGLEERTSYLNRVGRVGEGHGLTADCIVINDHLQQLKKEYKEVYTGAEQYLEEIIDACEELEKTNSGCFHTNKLLDNLKSIFRSYKRRRSDHECECKD
jgi:DNA repair ATPase RecN